MIERQVITQRSSTGDTIGVALFVIAGALFFMIAGARIEQLVNRPAACEHAAYMNGSTMPRPANVGYRDVAVGDGTLSLAKWHGSNTLGDSTLTVSGNTTLEDDAADVLTIRNTVDLKPISTMRDFEGNEVVPVECPNSCTEQPDGSRFCFALACYQRVWTSSITVFGDAYKDGDEFRRYDTVTLMSKHWACNATDSGVTCRNTGAPQ